MTKTNRLSFDIGGTFTDIVLHKHSENEFCIHKCLTTPNDPSKGSINGINELLYQEKLGLKDINQIVHGTTLVTNTLIERTGAKVGLLCTKGFKDLLEMGTEQRYDIHDLFLKYPEPIVPRNLCLEINERIDRDGKVIKKVDIDDIKKKIKFFLQHGVESIAICFLHSYRNPFNERLVKKIIAKNYPFLEISVSNEINPQLREYERTSTTVINAYVKPLMSKYVNKLSSIFKKNGFKGSFLFMQSSGGLNSPEVAIKYPVRFVESGPAGGGQASSWIGKTVGKKDLISFDMGGTTAKSCLIQNEKPDIKSFIEVGRVHRFKKGSGMPVRASTIDMIEIGAGGGSVAWIDEMKLMKIGPKSSGSKPGPICYSMGGREPTITDANLILGYLNPDYFLGGKIKLNFENAKESFENLGKQLSVSWLKAAWGAYDLVCENMASAARVHVVEKGRDPRNYSMVCMGGAGPVHAVNVAKKLGISEIIIPPGSGAASAIGMLVSPVSFTVTRSKPYILNNVDCNEINDLFHKMEQECFKNVAYSKIHKKNFIIERFAEMRLLGQMHEISISLSNKDLNKSSLKDIEKSFKNEYSRIYNHIYDDAKIQILNWKVTIKTVTPFYKSHIKDNYDKNNQITSRQVYFEDYGKLIKTKVYNRYDLSPGINLEGPLVVEELESTTILPPGCKLLIDKYKNIIINLKKSNNTKLDYHQSKNFKDLEKKFQSDPIALEIMWSRLINITEECWETVIRTAFSIIIGECQDFACELLDSNGNQLVHSPRAMPVFNICLPNAVKSMLKRYPPDSLEPGDVLITNDPWLCSGHLYDIAFATPVFKNKKLVAFVGIVGHVSDIGGIRNELSAKEIYDEGLQIPPLKLFKANHPNQDLFDLIYENVRNPKQVMGDIHAIVTASKICAERLIDFINEYGIYDFEPIAKVLQSRANLAMRKAIREIPDGKYKNVIWADGIDEPLKFPVLIEINGENLNVNYKGAPKQLLFGGSNSTFNYTLAHSTYPLKCVLTPDVPSNSGCYEPMNVEAPKNSILNCSKPMSVSARIRTGWYVGPNIYGALAEIIPHKVQAFTGLPSSVYFYGEDENGIFNDHLFQGGGQGASFNRDGKNSLLWPTSAASTSIEMLENRVPIVIIEKRLIMDSGGDGQFRGGLGQVIRVKKLYNDNKTIEAGIFPIGVKIPPSGLLGGQSGSPAKAFFYSDNKTDQDLGIGDLVRLKNKKDVIELKIAGGAGFGDPKKRDSNHIYQDVELEYVSIEKAKKIYGYNMNK